MRPQSPATVHEHHEDESACLPATSKASVVTSSLEPLPSPYLLASIAGRARHHLGRNATTYILLTPVLPNGVILGQMVVILGVVSSGALPVFDRADGCVVRVNRRGVVCGGVLAHCMTG
jgi:hypothetical protein